MAFDVNAINGRTVAPNNFGAGYVTQLFQGTPPNLVVNPDGSYTVTSTQESDEDGGGYPYLITAYNAALAPNVIEYNQVVGGVVDRSFTLGAVAVASDTKGTIFEQIQGFAPIGQAQGTYIGSFTTAQFTTGQYFIITNGIDLDKFDPISGAAIPSGLVTPATFASLTPAASGVPLPGMGLTLACAVIALVVVRTLSGRGNAAAV